jgi:hypothetical protein
MTQPFRLAAPVAPEDDIHAPVARAPDRLMLPPAQRTTFPAGDVKPTGQAAAKLARPSFKRGRPNVAVLCSVLHGIELKRIDGTLSHTRMVLTRRGSLRWSRDSAARSRFSRRPG